MSTAFHELWAFSVKFLSSGFPRIHDNMWNNPRSSVATTEALLEASEGTF